MASLITTVYNESSSIIALLNSIAKQTLRPDEVIIVDGGSTDDTVNKINTWIKKHPKVHVNVYTRTGNIATGRNYAISHAKSDIIAVTDAGCILQVDWFEKITAPLRAKNADVVAGYYTPTGDSVFQKCLAAYTSVMPDKLNPSSYLPSSRSIAFTKKAWKSVGGYPEHLDTCEDLVFARSLYNSDFRHIMKQDAVVSWPQKKSFIAALKQFYRYAVGDGQAVYIRPQTPLLFGRYIVGVLLLWYAYATSSQSTYMIIVGIVGAYLYWSIAKNYRYVKKQQALIYLPVLQIGSDIAVIVGMSIGLIQYVYRRF